MAELGIRGRLRACAFLGVLVRIQSGASRGQKRSAPFSFPAPPIHHLALVVDLLSPTFSSHSHYGLQIRPPVDEPGREHRLCEHLCCRSPVIAFDSAWGQASRRPHLKSRCWDERRLFHGGSRCPKSSNSRFSIIVTWYSFVVATSVAGYAERTTEVVTTNSITGIAAPKVTYTRRCGGARGGHPPHLEGASPSCADWERPPSA